MDIITKTGEIWSENAIGAVISLIKESDDSIEAERKLTHWLTEMNCQLIAMALARIDTELYQIGYCRNESPVLQLSHETAGAELVR